jgi:predicted heme/steroid binding protein
LVWLFDPFDVGCSWVPVTLLYPDAGDQGNLRWWSKRMKYLRMLILKGCDYVVADIIEKMQIPDQKVTLSELRRNNGDLGSRKYVAFRGVVYDVTDCPRWRLDLHERLHFPGQDLTGELGDAPHQESVFSRPCVKVVGRLEE